MVAKTRPSKKRTHLRRGEVSLLLIKEFIVQGGAVGLVPEWRHGGSDTGNRGGTQKPMSSQHTNNENLHLTARTNFHMHGCMDNDPAPGLSIRHPHHESPFEGLLSQTPQRDFKGNKYKTPLDIWSRITAEMKLHNMHQTPDLRKVFFIDLKLL